MKKTVVAVCAFLLCASFQAFSQESVATGNVSEKDDTSYETVIEATGISYEDEKLKSRKSVSKAAEGAVTDILRIEEKITKGWSGVRGCGDNQTIQNNAKVALDEWVKNKIFQNINRQVLRYGVAGKINASWVNRTAPWPDNRRSCSGSLAMTAYIEFSK